MTDKYKAPDLRHQDKEKSVKESLDDDLSAIVSAILKEQKEKDRVESNVILDVLKNTNARIDISDERFKDLRKAAYKDLNDLESKTRIGNIIKSVVKDPKVIAAVVLGAILAYQAYSKIGGQ